MLVSLLTVVAALAVALAVLVVRLGRLRDQAEQAGARLAAVERRAEQAALAGRAALSPPAVGGDAEPRPDAAERRPPRRARRMTALPERP